MTSSNFRVNLLIREHFHQPGYTPWNCWIIFEHQSWEGILARGNKSLHTHIDVKFVYRTFHICEVCYPLVNSPEAMEIPMSKWGIFHGYVSLQECIFYIVLYVLPNITPIIFHHLASPLKEKRVIFHQPIFLQSGHFWEDTSPLKTPHLGAPILGDI